MACTSCEGKASIQLSYVDREYCDDCFLEYIEQRVRKDIRLNKDIEPLDTVYVYDDDSKESYLSKFFLERVFEDNLTVKITEEREEPGDGKLVIPTNMERELSEKLRHFLQNSHKEDDDILLLDNVLEEEMVKLCDILGKEAEETEEVNMLIERMEEKYPDTKFSLKSAFEKLEEHLS